MGAIITIDKSAVSKRITSNMRTPKNFEYDYIFLKSDQSNNYAVRLEFMNPDKLIEFILTYPDLILNE